MPSTINATFGSNLTVTETFTGTYIAANNPITVNGLNENASYTATTTPPVSKQVSFQQALTSGAATIDFSALPGLTVDETVNATGLKLQFMKLRNLSTNANKIVVSQGAANAYRLDAATNWNLSLAPGQSILWAGNAGAEAVASGHKTIDLAGTAAQVLEVQLVFG